MSQFTVQLAPEQSRDGVEVVRVAGELDTLSFQQFQELAEDLMAQGHHRLVVDCSKLAYIASAGLAILYKMVNQARAEGGDLRLAALNGKIFTIVDMLGFSKLIRCFDQVDEAVSSFP